MENEKYHGGLKIFKNIETDVITHKQSSNIKTIEIDISEAEILRLINNIPEVYSLEDKEYGEAILLIKLVSKLSEAWSRKQNIGEMGE